MRPVPNAPAHETAAEPMARRAPYDAGPLCAVGVLLEKPVVALLHEGTPCPPKEHQEIIHSIKSQIDLLTEEVAQAICEDCSAERALRKLEFLSNPLARIESQL